MNWVQSIFTGEPVLGWPDTLAFLSLPLILYVSQTISQKVLTPPRDTSRPRTDQEEFSQGLINNLPLIVTAFSINVPAGLTIYLITNNFLTTILTLALKSQIKLDDLPMEVTRLMEIVDAPAPVKKSSGGSSSAAINRKSLLLEETLPKKEIGFGTREVVPPEVAAASKVDVEDASDEEGSETVEEAEQEARSESGDEAGKKKKRRVKPAAAKKDRKRAD